MTSFRKILNSVRAVLLITTLLFVSQSNVLSQDHRWQLISTIPNTTDASALMFANDSFGLLLRVGSDEHVNVSPCLITTNGGQSWTERGLRTQYPYATSYNQQPHLDTSGYVFYFHSSTIGKPYADFSTDSGTSWKRVAATIDITSMIGNHFVSPSTFFMLWTSKNDKGSIVYQATRDSGKNFEFIQDAYFLLAGDYAASGCMYDTASAWVFVASENEDGSFMMHTTTSGSEWTKYYPFRNPELDRLTLYPNTGHTYQRTIQGARRETILLTNIGRRDYDRDTVRKLIIFKVYGLVISTDEGKTWWCDTTFQTKTSYMSNTKDSTLWGVVRDSSTVIRSTNFGRVWEYDSTSFNGEPISLMYWRDADNGYVVTYKDSTVRIYKYQTTSSVGEEEEFTEQLSSVSIYPNPATKTITIASVEQPSPFRIYDVLGREVLNGMTLDRAPLTLDVSHVARGVYYLFVDSPRTGRAVMAGKILLAEE